MSLLYRPGGLSSSGPTWLARQLALADAVDWVDSATGSDSNAGEEWLPKASVFGASGALASASTLVSNLIICMATHREIIAAAYTWAKAGVNLVGLGVGTSRPQFTSAVAGTAIAVTGADVHIENVYFPASTATTTIRISVGAAGFELRDSKMDLGENDTTDGVLVNAVTYASFRGCTWKASARPTGTTQVGLRITGASTSALIEDCVFDGGAVGFTDAAAKLDTATADRFRFRSCTLQNYAVVKVSTGGIKGLHAYTTDATSRLEWTE
jgi:hypothetical protein